jgi:hypothetical protein
MLRSRPIAETGTNNLWVPFQFSVLALLLLMAASIAILYGPVGALPFFLLLVIAAIWRWPQAVGAIVVLLLPFQPAAILLVEGAGVPHAQAISALKELILCLCVLRLWRNLEWERRDWLLVGLLGSAAVWFLFSARAADLKNDFDWLLAYLFAKSLRVENPQFWFRAAARVMTVVAIGGIVEYAFLGSAPRAFLLNWANSDLPQTFGVFGFEGTRAASTLMATIDFGAMTAYATVIAAIEGQWLVAPILLAGLLCSVTRSAWVAALLLLLLFARKKRVFLIPLGILILLLPFALAYMGLSDFIAATKRGDDISAASHRENLIASSESVLQHPFGKGPGTAGIRAFAEHAEAVVVENTYLTFAYEYGWLAGICFTAFVFLSLRAAWRISLEAFSGLAVCAIMGLVVPTHVSFPVVAWVWAGSMLAARDDVKPSREAPSLLLRADGWLTRFGL